MIRPAQPDDTHQILAFIAELAEYERLSHELATDASRLHEHLFGPRPICEALMAEQGRVAVGFALFFASYSTFKTQSCLHLEDLYVTPSARGQGHGKALLHELARIALERGVARLTWNVLDWNQPAIDFYEQLGAQVLSDWRIARVEGPAIEQLCQRSRA